MLVVDTVAMIAIVRRLPYFAVALTAATAMLATLAGCANEPTSPPSGQRGARPTPAESMIVPNADSALARGLRRVLAGRGWHLVGYSDDLIHGHSDYGDYRAMARRAQYRLTLKGTTVGPCRDGGQGFLYSIAIIENIGGDVPVALAGAGCLTRILGQFATELEQKQLASLLR
ncbi:hypothetical protein [Salinisphaera sp.]|uniref:hypothetical protein n=1 Tax=Salinisphaera sp. TaxID=1914330 RepID=UPI002D78634A|nr:hypothetical protein [Salinisphaera sp.]HET7315408.1 hypothetical protein [Salinisphaera sp.]